MTNRNKSIASGIHCARCAAPYPLSIAARAKAAIRRWLGIEVGPSPKSWTYSEILAISREIGVLKGILIAKGVCTDDEIDVEIERHKAACGE